MQTYKKIKVEIKVRMSENVGKFKYCTGKSEVQKWSTDNKIRKRTVQGRKTTKKCSKGIKILPQAWKK